MRFCSCNPPAHGEDLRAFRLLLRPSTDFIEQRVFLPAHVAAGVVVGPPCFVAFGFQCAELAMLLQFFAPDELPRVEIRAADFRWPEAPLWCLATTALAGPRRVGRSSWPATRSRSASPSQPGCRS